MVNVTGTVGPRSHLLIPGRIDVTMRAPLPLKMINGFGKLIADVIPGSNKQMRL